MASPPGARTRQISSSKNFQPNIPEIVSLEDDLQWVEFEIPESNQPVLLARLRSDPDTRGFTSIVRFPESWKRPTPGTYSADEEFIILEGSLEMNGKTFRSNDWVFVPAGAARENTASPLGGLTLASFSGPARWLPASVDANQDQAEILTSKLEGSGESTVSPFGQAWLLFSGKGSSSWLIDSIDAGISPSDVEVLEIEARRWMWVTKGSEIPHCSGRCFCRTFDK